MAANTRVKKKIHKIVSKEKQTIDAPAGLSVWNWERLALVWIRLPHGGILRPLGVTLAAGYEFLRAALIALLACAVLFVGNMASRLAGLAAEGNLLQNLLAGFGKFVGVALLLYAAIQLVLGIGLLLRQNWARLLVIIFSGIGFLLLLPRLLHLRPVSTLFALLNVAVMIYLYLPGTRLYFEQKGEITPNPV
jgi:uncharacterized membrane protein (DUF2068 family)